MTRSNDPFEDLPEWKERRRLQEIQAMREAAERATPGHVQDRTVPFGAAANGFPSAGPLDAGHQHQAPGQWPGSDAQPSFDAGHPRQVPAYADYDQYGYQTDYAQTGYAEAPQQPDHPAPGFHDGWQADHRFAHQQQPTAPDFRAGAYDDPRFAYPAEAYPAEPAPAPSLDDYRAPGAPPLGEPSFGAPQPYFSEAPADDGHYRDARYDDPVEGGQYDDEYEYDYEDEDEEEGGGRYGWKLMAAMVVAGVMVVGGGVFLYDMLAGGEATGPAPVIKADRGPAKTAPSDPGGKSFANQDSKLLGRLDNTNPSTRRVELDSDGRGRVREVPTVRVTPDGRLILPKEPQGAANAATAAQDDDSPSAATSMPGINIVDSLNGSSRSGLGGVGLPPVVPKAPTPSEPIAAASTRTVTTTGQPASSPSDPIIRNRSGASQGANLATARADTPPPVPQKSALSSAWRMTRPATPTATPAATATRTAAPATRPVTPDSTAATTTASTLGAAAVAQGGARQYIAVVATKSTRMEALESFAELQQRHPQALSNRVPTVQQADLSSRGLGTMYRLLVGPAGSREAANTVCANLKASGYNGCWVKSH
jgi:hypothetical protein